MMTPPLAVRARRFALETGLETSWRDEDGALVHVLAAGGRVRRAGEIGTGTGVATAWVAAGLPPGVPLYTAEPDAARAAAIAALFVGDADVHVLHGDWHDVLVRESPFDLLFAGATGARDDVETVLGLLAPGGLVVMGDFSADRTGPDPRWLAHPRVDAVVVGTGGSAQALVATVRG